MQTINDTGSSLGPYLRAINAHRVAVVLTMLATLAGCAAWLSLRTPDYRADAEVLVTPLPQGDTTFVGIPFLISSDSDPTRTVQTAATLISSQGAAEATARELGGGLTAQQVLDAVVVKPKGESNVLQVQATSESAALARDLANTFTRASLRLRARQLREQIDATITRLRESQSDAGGAAQGTASADLSARITALENVRDGNDPTLSVSESAVLPSAAVGAPSWLIVVLALFAGSILGAACALLLELSERRLRDVDDLLTVFPLPVLARVPKLSRRALRRTTTALPPQVREPLRTLQAQLEVRGRSHRSRCVMVTSATRSDGKTTTAVNLALSLTASGQNVLLVDLDLRKPDVASRLGVTRLAPGLSAMLQDGVRLEEVLTEVPDVPLLRVATVAEPPTGVGALEAHLRLVPRVLAEADDLADYVVVDTAPLGEVADAMRIADQADDVLLVTRPGHTVRANLEQARDLLRNASDQPTGMIIVGDPEATSGVSYGYGYGASEAERRGTVARLTRR